jgi:hypothetical protein
LSNINSNLQVKVPFSVKYKHKFNMFDERERIECVLSILEEEIDFGNLVASGVILSHGPMMKRKVYDDIYENYHIVKWKLMKGFISGNWQVHSGPINIVKSYYGEKAAFQFAYLLHYQSWLLIPTIAGIISFFYQVAFYFDTKNVTETLDGTLNGYYGFFIAIWGSFFYKSWIETEKILQFMWDTDNKSQKRDDERKDTFLSHYIYNDITRVQEKIKL